MAGLSSLLKESLFDEQRIVTYMYLSRRANVSCIEATQAMKELYDQRKEGDPLNAVFSLIGQLKTTNGTKTRRVTLVRERDLEKAKVKFEKVVSCDIYSLQTTVIRNLNILYGVDKVDEDEYAARDVANCVVQCTQLAEEGRRSRSATPLLWSSSSSDESVVGVKVEKKVADKVEKISEKKTPAPTPTPVRPPPPPSVAKQSSLSAAFAKVKPPQPKSEVVEDKTEVVEDIKPSASKAPPPRSEKRPTKSPVKVEAPKAKKVKSEPKKVKNESKKKTRRIRIDSESDEEEEEDEKSNGQNAEPVTGTKNSASQDSTKDMFSSGDTGCSTKDMFDSSDSSPERRTSPPPKPSLRRSPRKTVAVASDSDDDFVPIAPKKIVRQEHVPETFKDEQGFLVTKEVTKAVVVSAPVDEKEKEPEKALRPLKVNQVQEAPKKRSGKQAPPNQTKISNFFGKK